MNKIRNDYEIINDDVGFVFFGFYVCVGVVG